jgi:dihydroorotase
VKEGRVLSEVCEARARGVLFDLGHGSTSFDFSVARAALASGFAPDTLSTDLQRNHLGQRPSHDLPLVMSKLRAAGMEQSAIFTAVTATPARLLGRQGQFGALVPGLSADLSILRWQEEVVPLADTLGATLLAGRWVSVATFRGGVPAVCE